MLCTGVVAAFSMLRTLAQQNRLGIGLDAKQHIGFAAQVAAAVVARLAVQLIGGHIQVAVRRER